MGNSLGSHGSNKDIPAAPETLEDAPNCVTFETPNVEQQHEHEPEEVSS